MPPQYRGTGKTAADCSQHLQCGLVNPNVFLELRPSLVDQIKADVGCGGVTVFTGGAFVRQLNSLECHLVFRGRTFFGNFFHRMTVTIASGKIHFVIDVAGILAQGLLDDAHGLDKNAPVHCTQESKAVDGIADGHPISGLLLIFRPYQLFNCLA